jgi:capsular exopolysaccharide synthesis family protein
MLAHRNLSDPNLADFMATAPEDETLDLVRYWRAINRNKYRIFALVLAVGVFAALVAQSLPHMFRSTTTMLIEASKQKIVSIEEVYNVAAGLNREYYQTQYEILKSRELAASLVRKLKLGEHPALDPRRQPPPFWHAWLPAGFIHPAGATPPSEAEIEQRVIRAVQTALGVQLVRNSQLVRLSFDTTDRELAAQVPNALAEIYIDADLQARMQMTQRAMAFINTQVGDLRTKLQESEQGLQAFRDRERIIDAKGLAQSGATRQIEDLTRQLGEARARRSEAETTYNQVTSAVRAGVTALETLPAMQKQPLVIRSREAETDAERRLNEAAKRYGAEHPKMIAAESELKSARENLRRQITVVTQTVTRELEVAKANEQAVERALTAAKADVANLNRKEFQLASLEREVQNNRQLYEMFIQRLKETNISEAMQTANARVIDPAMTPQTPSGPNKRAIVGLAILGALLLGVSLALLLERLDNTVKTSHEVEQKLGVPALGVVQYTRVKRGQQLERIFLDEPQTAVAEAIRTIRSAVLLSALDSPKKIVLVTSSVPREGKTTIAANLALALGQVKKTLLVDADMRRPSIGRVFAGKQALPGLSDLCAGNAEAGQCVFPVTEGQVYVLASGKVPPNPQELLASNRFEQILGALAADFDVVVLDSPPLQLVSDALVLSRLATEVLYVVKADETPYPVARQGLRKLLRLNAPVVGVVLNQLDLLKADRYYGEYSGYGRRYYNKKYGYGYTGK